VVLVVVVVVVVVVVGNHSAEVAGTCAQQRLQPVDGGCRCRQIMHPFAALKTTSQNATDSLTLTLSRDREVPVVC